ncbi:MAG: magnesium transporter [Bacteroidota bacterium]|nr:magnesium transporter [Bacteroidota bacterium]MDX5428852.1 magnesium transporter [Bacteroidota bacterium]MDX5448742.1 magnesium transporter [Bacteroidota bacterium]MDX5506539.1 magnesium transporter [Bacteroidota bacterium]
MSFEITTEKLDELRERIRDGYAESVSVQLSDLHYADVAEILERLESEDAVELFLCFDEEFAAEVLIELSEDLRKKILHDYSGKEIATELVENLDSDDAADILNELSEEKKREVLDNLEDVEQAKQIAGLLTHAEDTAGALMATELIKVNENWTVRHCVREMRRQAENVEEVHAVYVVDDHDVLKGTLSLKKLLTTSTRTPVRELYNQKVISVRSTTDVEEVAQIMEKYDLVVMPVVDEIGRLLGRITIDDVVDVIKEEAERDYNLASGITNDVEYNASIFKVTKARLPWLLIGIVGGLLSASVISQNEGDIALIPQLAFFVPLIAATGGNVGVQSSAIVVQALANNSFDDNIAKRLTKELLVGLLNGAIVAAFLLGIGMATGLRNDISLTVSLSLFAVVIFASLFGTFVPIILDKYKVDPALATGPFITTTNDVLGLFIYFSIGGIILGI